MRTVAWLTPLFGPGTSSATTASPTRILALSLRRTTSWTFRRANRRYKPWLKGVQYFRYPFLRQGNTVEKRDAVLSWMASRGIVVAPVTIDNNDYLYNQQLVDSKAEGRTIDVRDAYLGHMMEAAAYYDAKGRARMGRAIKQVLLLHMNLGTISVRF